MNSQRELVLEFEHVCDTLLKACPQLELATDIICGFPGETEEDFEATMRLVAKYRFLHCHISQFYPRPGTPAARMKRVPTNIVKQRTRRLTTLVESFDDGYDALVGEEMKVWVMDTAADGKHLVGHSKSYTQILLPFQEDLLGSVVKARITSASRWSVKAEVTEWIFNPNKKTTSKAETNNASVTKTETRNGSETKTEPRNTVEEKTEVRTSMGLQGRESFWQKTIHWTLLVLLIAVLIMSVNVWLES